MKKRLLAVLLCICVVFCFAGCKKENGDVFGYSVPGGKLIVPGDKFSSDSITELTTIGFLEAPSCYFDGLDRVYYYDGFDVNTYPSGDEEYVQSIQVNKEGVTTSKKIGVGSSHDDVIKAYGEDCEIAGMMYRYYVQDNKYLYFFIMNDIVKYYGYAIDVK